MVVANREIMTTCAFAATEPSALMATQLHVDGLFENGADVVAAQREDVAVDGTGGVGEGHRLVGVEVRRGLVGILGLGRIDVLRLTEPVDDPLSGTLSTVVAVEAPRVERVVVREVELERPAVEVIEVKLWATGKRAASVVGSCGVARSHEPFGVLHVHHLRAVHRLQEAHAPRSGGVEQRCENLGLRETGDVNVGHDFSLSSS